MSNIEVGKRIKEFREEIKMTREELAEKVGISTKFLYEVENGKKGLSAETLLKISKALSCSCDYILLGKKNENYEIINSVLGNFNKKQLRYIGEILRLIYEIGKEK